MTIPFQTLGKKHEAVKGKSKKSKKIKEKKSYLDLDWGEEEEGLGRGKLGGQFWTENSPWLMRALHIYIYIYKDRWERERERETIYRLRACDYVSEREKKKY